MVLALHSFVSRHYVHGDPRSGQIAAACMQLENESLRALDAKITLVQPEGTNGDEVRDVWGAADAVPHQEADTSLHVPDFVSGEILGLLGWMRVQVKSSEWRGLLPVIPMLERATFEKIHGYHFTSRIGHPNGKDCRPIDELHPIFSVVPV